MSAAGGHFRNHVGRFFLYLSWGREALFVEVHLAPERNPPAEGGDQDIGSESSQEIGKEGGMGVEEEG